MKTVKSLKESDLLIKGISEKIKNEAKKKVGFFCMLLGTLGAILLGNLLTGKGAKRPNSSNIPRWGVMRAGEGTELVKIINIASSCN